MHEQHNFKDVGFLGFKPVTLVPIQVGCFTSLLTNLIVEQNDRRQSTQPRTDQVG